MSEIKAMVERLGVYSDTLRVTAALRIAVETLAYYMGGDDPDRAREAIERIEKRLDPEATLSPLADLDGKQASPRKRKRAPSPKARKP